MPINWNDFRKELYTDSVAPEQEKSVQTGINWGEFRKELYEPTKVTTQPQVTTQPTRQPQQRDSFLQQVTIKPAKTLYGGILENASDTAGTLDFYADKIANILNIPETKGSIFEKLKENWGYWGNRLKQEGLSEGIIRDIYSGAGGLAWDLPVKYMAPGKVLGGATLPTIGALEGYKTGGREGALMGVAQGGLTHGVVKGLQTLPTALKLPAAFSFGAATTPGTREEKISSGLLWAGLSMGKGPSWDEFKNTQRQYNLLVQKGENFYQGMFNRYHAIEDIVLRAQKLGMKIRPGENAGLRAREYLGIGGKAESILNDKTYTVNPDGTYRITGEGLKPILTDYGKMSKGNKVVARQDLNDYLIAKRTLQDLQRPKYPSSKENIVTKQQVADAKVKIDLLQKKYGVSKTGQFSIDFFEPIAQRLHGYQQRVLQLLVDSGLKSQEQVNNIIAQNPNYIPFNRVMGGVESQVVTTPKTRHRFSQPTQPIKAIKGSELEIIDPMESIIKNTYKILDAAERNIVTRNVTRLNTVFPQEISPVSPAIRPVATVDGKPIFRTTGKGKGRNIITVYENGARKYYEVSNNLYQAMSGLTEQSSSLLTRIMAQPANWVRAGATLIPEFALRNPIRDQFSALLQTNFGFKPFIDPLNAISDIMGNTKVYNDFLRSGGSYATLNELSRKQIQLKLKDLTSSKGKNLLKRLNIIADARDLSQLFEQATRVGVFKAATRSGLSPIEAGFQARESTVDFARRGSATKDINATIAFFNAGLQGTDKSIRTAIADPMGLTAKAIATITIPSVLLYMRNKDDAKYWEIPQWQRDLFWIVRTGSEGKEKYWRIPKPFLYGQVFGSLPERFMRYSEARDPDAFKGIGNTLLQAGSPVGSPEEAAFLPNAVKPLVENFTNWNFFMGRNVVPESKSRLRPEYQSTAYTSTTAKALGKALNYSPAKIENFMRGYMAGSSQYALGASDLVLNQIRRLSGETLPQNPIEAADIPALKGFAVRDPIGPSAESIQMFYDKANLITQYYNTGKMLKESGQIEAAKKLYKEHPEVENYTEVNRVIKELGDLRRKRNQMREMILPVELKKKYYKEIDTQMVTMVRGFNKLYNQ